MNGGESDRDWKVVPSRPGRNTAKLRDEEQTREQDRKSGRSLGLSLRERPGGLIRLKDGAPRGVFQRETEDSVPEVNEERTLPPRSNGRSSHESAESQAFDSHLPNGKTEKEKFPVRTEKILTPAQEEKRRNKIGAPIRRAPVAVRRGRGSELMRKAGERSSDGLFGVAGGELEAEGERRGLRVTGSSRGGRQRGILRLPETAALNDGQRAETRGRQDEGEREEEFVFGGNEDWPVIIGTSRAPGEEGGGGGGGGVGGGRGGEGATWSKVLKSQAPPLSRRADKQQDTRHHNDLLSSSSEGEEEHRTGGKKKKKKKKKKEEVKKREPFTLELGSMLDVLQTSQGSRSKVATGSAPVIQRSSKPIKTPDKATDTRNVLDSSAPTVRRGKEREVPKKKKPSSIRKVIAKEKEEKKRLHEQGLPIPYDLDVSKEVASDTDYSCHSDVESDHGPPTVHPIHTRKFREYCTHMVSEEINGTVELLLADLLRFQDRQFLKDPIKAKARRRYVCGLREVTKHLKLKRLKCVIIPPSLEKIQSTGGINNAVQDIISLCQDFGVRLVFAMSRRRLAYMLKKKHKVGCCGIFSYDGAEAHYKKLVQLVDDATERYRSIVSSPIHPESHQQPKVAGEEEGRLDVGAGLSQASSSDADTYCSHKTESSFDDSDGPAERANGHETKPITDTPWKIFFSSESSSAAAATAVDTSEHHEARENKPSSHVTPSAKKHPHAKVVSKAAPPGVAEPEISSKPSHRQPGLADHGRPSRSSHQDHSQRREPRLRVDSEMADPSHVHPRAMPWAAAANSRQPLLPGIPSFDVSNRDFVAPNYPPLPHVLRMPAFAHAYGIHPTSWMQGYPVPNPLMFHAGAPRFGMELGQNVYHDDETSDEYRLNVNAVEFVPGHPSTNS